MPVPMVDIGIMRVRVRQPLVAMGVAVRLPLVGPRRVVVPVMLVMLVPVRVLEPLVRVQVLVTLRQVQHCAHSHEHPRRHEATLDRLM